MRRPIYGHPPCPHTQPIKDLHRPSSPWPPCPHASMPPSTKNQGPTPSIKPRTHAFHPSHAPMHPMPPCTTQAHQPKDLRRPSYALKHARSRTYAVHHAPMHPMTQAHQIGNPRRPPCPQADQSKDLRRPIKPPPHAFKHTRLRTHGVLYMPLMQRIQVDHSCPRHATISTYSSRSLPPKHLHIKRLDIRPGSPRSTSRQPWKTDGRRRPHVLPWRSHPCPITLSPADPKPPRPEESSSSRPRIPQAVRVCSPSSRANTQATAEQITQSSTRSSDPSVPPPIWRSRPCSQPPPPAASLSSAVPQSKPAILSLAFSKVFTRMLQGPRGHRSALDLDPAHTRSPDRSQEHLRPFTQSFRLSTVPCCSSASVKEAPVASCPTTIVFAAPPIRILAPARWKSLSSSSSTCSS
ncbi:hypothetical protein V8E36_004448 [Tilletia maclaganii]